MLSQIPFSAMSRAVGFVHQVAVLDALDAGGDRPLDRSRRVGMGAEIRAPVFRGFDGGAQLGLGERGHVERAERGRHAAACRQLDLRRALHQLLAHAKAHFVRAVGNHGSAKLLDTAEHAAKGPRQIGELAEVAVTAGHRDDRPGRIDARPGQQPFVDGAFQAESGPAQVADGGEAAHQRGRGLGPRQEVAVADVVGKKLRGRRPYHRRMPVRVDQARHQHPPACRNDADVVDLVDRDRARRYAFDDVALHQHVGRSRERGTPAVEDADVSGKALRLLSQTPCLARGLRRTIPHP